MSISLTRQPSNHLNITYSVYMKIGFDDKLGIYSGVFFIIFPIDIQTK